MADVIKDISTLEDNQTNGNQLVQIVDAGGGVATVTGGALDVNAIVNLGSSGTFGDNSSKGTVALSDVSVNVVLSDADRKEVYIVNSTNKTIWICLGSPAVFGNGIPLFKDDILIEDRYRGVITAIMDTGESGNIQVTDITL